jgi:predicted chitinase
MGWLLMVLLVKKNNKIKQVLNTIKSSISTFLGQVAHETNFNLDTENLNYSAAGLVSTFKNIFQHQNLQLVMLDNQKR